MAIATVLKTVVRKDLQVRILCPPLRALLGALSLVVLASVALPMTPSTVCACTTRAGLGRAAMRTDLRHLADAQELFKADSGRYTSLAELSAAQLWQPSAGVTATEFILETDGWSARLANRADPGVACWMRVGAGSDGAPVCDPYPTDDTHLRFAIAYLVLLVSAFLAERWRVHRGDIPRSRGRLAVLVLLLVAHPFWEPVRELTPGTACWGGRFDFPSVTFVALLLASILITYRPGGPASH
jgi:hypothetical protein